VRSHEDNGLLKGTIDSDHDGKKEGTSSLYVVSVIDYNTRADLYYV
jgi:hypothetical protein